MHCWGGVPARGVFLPRGCTYLGGVCLPGGSIVEGYLPGGVPVWVVPAQGSVPARGGVPAQGVGRCTCPGGYLHRYSPLWTESQTGANILPAQFQTDRVLCVVLVNISWAGPLSLIKFHSINNDLDLTNHVGFRKILIFLQTDRFLLQNDEVTFCRQIFSYWNMWLFIRISSAELFFPLTCMGASWHPNIQLSTNFLTKPAPEKASLKLSSLESSLSQRFLFVEKLLQTPRRNSSHPRQAHKWFYYSYPWENFLFKAWLKNFS